MLTRALINPFSSDLSVTCSVGNGFSSVVEIGTSKEPSGAASGDEFVVHPCQNQKTWYVIFGGVLWQSRLVGVSSFA
jgi:hypothetical protein